MRKLRSEDTHLKLHRDTREKIESIVAASSAPSGISRTIRELVHKYYKLLQSQLAAEQQGASLWLVCRRGPEDQDLFREKVDLRL